MSLHVYTSHWAMQPHDPSGVILPDAEIAAMVADAGYHGLALDLGAADVATARAMQPHLARHNLTPLIVAFPRTVGALREALVMAQDFGSPFVVVVGQVMPTTVSGMIPVIRAWIEMSDQVGTPVHFETHRNCITNDLFSTLQLLDAVPEMRMAADLSHYIVDREFRHPLSATDRAQLSRVLARSDSFQGRVASRQQIQLQLSFPQHAKWVALFRDLWAEGLAGFKARSDAACHFLCELGPPEYAMTDAHGREMSNRWDEALQIKAWVEEIWATLP